jgi:hypothetical protein
MLAALARPVALVLLPVSLLVVTTPHAVGQAQPKQKSPPPPQAAAQTAGQAGSPPQAQPQVAVPDANKLAILIHTSLIALNQANLTGNYTVLRDLAAPGFQQANSPAKLAEIFSQLRRQRLDLGPIVLFTPKLVRHPVVDERGLLTLSGFFDTQPQRVEFDLLFQPVGGEWRLFGIRAGTAPASPQTADAGERSPAPPPAAKTTPPAKKK